MKVTRIELWRDGVDWLARLFWDGKPTDWLLTPFHGPATFDRVRTALLERNPGAEIVEVSEPENPSFHNSAAHAAPMPPQKSYRAPQILVHLTTEEARHWCRVHASNPSNNPSWRDAL